MTFTEIRAEIADRLNLTSTTALDRLGRAINRVYRAVTSSIGIETSRRAHVTADTSIGIATVQFTGVEKLLSVWVPDGSSNRILKEVTHAELLAMGNNAGDTPCAYAVTQMAADSVTITLDQTPQTVFTVHAEAQAEAATLSGTDEPALPASFHDILIDGVLADEYLKLEKGTLAAAAKQTYERRLGELRLRIAVSRSKTIQQGSAARGISGGVTGGGSGSLPNGGFSYTQTGLITFDRDPSAPFAVTDSSAHVPNLYAEGVGNVTSDRLIGRDTAGAGESEQLTVGGGIEFTGSGGIQTSALTGDVTKAAGGTATTIANDAVTDAKLRDSAAVSVIGRATNSSGDPADIAAGANDQFLVRRSNALAFVGGIVADGAGAIQQVAFAASQSASSNANTLDDYEEGTWTPVIGGGGGTSGQTYSAQQGSYVKIGQLVVAHFRVILSAKGTITGNVEIQGLPFTALNGVISSFLGDVAWDALGTNWVNINAQVQQNTTVAFVFGANAAGTSSLTALVTADITDTTALRGTAIYRAAN